MIVQCPDCSTRYELDDRRVPPGRIRVRCARCRYVFPIEAVADAPQPAPEERAPAAADPGITQDAWSSGAARPAAAVDVEPLDTTEHPTSAEYPQVEPMGGMESTRIEDPDELQLDPGLDLEIDRPEVGRPQQAPSAGPAQPAPEPEAPATATATEEAPVADADRKARRLARALVSDILVYNREKRDAALVDGTLVQALGQEIKKSWELYKERVTPEVANETNYFKEALNDILAEGQKVF